MNEVIIECPYLLNSLFSQSWNNMLCTSRIHWLPHIPNAVSVMPVTLYVFVPWLWMSQHAVCLWSGWPGYAFSAWRYIISSALRSQNKIVKWNTHQILIKYILNRKSAVINNTEQAWRLHVLSCIVITTLRNIYETCLMMKWEHSLLFILFL